MKNVADLSVTGSHIWCATDGGVFAYNKSNNSFQTIFKTDNISSQFVSSIAVDSLKQKVWIGTSEGFINIYDISSGDVHKVFDINRSNFTKKSITQLKVLGDTIALAA